MSINPISPNPPASYTPPMKGYSGQGAFRFWCQTVLPLVYDDSLSYYELLNKVVHYLNNTISDVANMEDNVGALHEAYSDLQAYVNNNYDQLVEAYNILEKYVDDYFTNLDVQNEIDTKLDEMATDGSLLAVIQPVVISSVPDAVADWLSEHITPTTPIVDDTLSISGAAADAKVTGDEIGELKSAITYIHDGSIASDEFVQGVRTSADLKTVVANTERCTSKTVFHLYKGDTITISNIASGTKSVILASNGYDSDWKTTNFTYTAPAEIDVIVNCAETSGHSAITPEDVTTKITVVSVFPFVEDVVAEVRQGNFEIAENILSAYYATKLSNGSVVNGVYSPTTKYRIATPEKVSCEKYVHVSVKTGFMAAFHVFYNNTFLGDSDWVESYVLRPGYDYLFAIKRSTEQTSEIADAEEFGNAVVFNQQTPYQIVDPVIISDPLTERLAHASRTVFDDYHNYTVYYAGETTTTEYIKNTDIGLKISKQSRINPYDVNVASLLQKGETVGSFTQSNMYSPYDPCMFIVNDNLRIWATLAGNDDALFIGYFDVNKGDLSINSAVTTCTFDYNIEDTDYSVPMTFANLKAFADLIRPTGAPHNLGDYPVMNGVRKYLNKLYTIITFISDDNDSTIAPIVCVSTNNGATWTVLSVLNDTYDDKQPWEAGFDIYGNDIYIALRLNNQTYTELIRYSISSKVAALTSQFNNQVVSRPDVLVIDSTIYIGLNTLPNVPSTSERSRAIVFLVNSKFIILDATEIINRTGLSYFSLVGQSKNMSIVFTEDYREAISYNKVDIAIKNITDAIFKVF